MWLKGSSCFSCPNLPSSSSPRPPPSLSQLGLWPQHLLNDGSSYRGKGRGRSISDRGSSKCRGPGAGMVFLEWRNRAEAVRHSQARVTAPSPAPRREPGASPPQQQPPHPADLLLGLPRARAPSVGHLSQPCRPQGSGRQGEWTWREHGQHWPAAKAGALALILH